MSPEEEFKGLVMVFTGNGKGKSTAALGQAMRAVGHGQKACIIQFLKGSKNYGEITAAKRLYPDLVIYQSGLETFVNSNQPAQIDIDFARRGFNMAREIAQSSQYQMLILDEINVAISFNLLSEAEVLQLILDKPPQLHLILTGRGATEKIVQQADLVSEIKEVKHHYALGIPSREGIEF